MKKAASRADLLDLHCMLRKIPEILNGVFVGSAPNEFDDLPFLQEKIFADAENCWHSSLKQTERNLFHALRSAAQQFPAEVKDFLGCTDYFINKLKNAADREISSMTIGGFSCFKCALSDEEICDMLDRAEKCTEIDQIVRNFHLKKFLHGFWHAAIHVLSHNKSLGKIFFHLSEETCEKLLSASDSWTIIWNFIHMCGHKFQLACEENLLLDGMDKVDDELNCKELDERIYGRLMRFQRPCSASLLSEFINQASHALDISDKANDPKAKMMAIFDYLHIGLPNVEAARMLGLKLKVFNFYRKRAQRRWWVDFSDSVCISTEYRFFRLKQCLGLMAESKRHRFLFYQELMGQIWAFMGLSKTQIMMLMGLSDSKAKRFRRKAMRLNLAGKHVEPKTKTLEFKIVESMFILAYCRIGGLKVLTEINPVAAHEAYTTLLRGLEFDKDNRFTKDVQGFDNFFELAVQLRQGRIKLEWCSITSCFYVKHWDEETQSYEGGCPFCAFKDGFFMRTLNS